MGWKKRQLFFHLICSLTQISEDSTMSFSYPDYQGRFLNEPWMSDVWWCWLRRLKNCGSKSLSRGEVKHQCHGLMNTYSQNAHHGVNPGPLAPKEPCCLSAFQRNASALRVFSSREQWDRYSVMVGLSSLVLMRLVVHLFESQNSWKLLLMVQAKYYEAVRAW